MKKLKKDVINQLVFDLRKPARYIGCELNQIRKNNPLIKMAVSYPDLYELGMSNNGIKILYDIANKASDVSCERVFAVPEDFENKIRKMNLPLYTLETYTPLNELDFIGFNVAYELLYTNILQIIDLGQIPVYSKNRSGSHPIIIAGGESVSNPLPLIDFIDAFFIGDGEEGIIDILDIFRTSKKESLSREDTLNLLYNINGIFIPAKTLFPAAQFSQENLSNGTNLPTNTINSGNTLLKTIKKRTVKSKGLHNPLNPVIPNMKITQERLVIEVTRGCKNLCNFCHAGYYELPYRHINPDILKTQILQLTNNPHYSEITLSSLSISDYRYLVKLLNQILPHLIDKGISISLPSLKVDKRTLPIIEQISDLRKTSLTFAVESGCNEIRNIANKKLNIDDILSIAEHVFSKGWNRLKLYFMIGLPGCEEYDEAEPIIELLRQLRNIGGKKRDLNVTISPFVPKPHTPFQWEKQMGPEYLLEMITKIRKSVPRQIAIKAHDVRASLLEGILARGDEKLNKVIYNSYLDGCRLDSWKENFHFNIWEKNLDIIPRWHEYMAAKDKIKPLPWQFISTGFERVINLQKDRINTEPCRIREKPYEDTLDKAAISHSMNKFSRKYDVKNRVRIKLSKRDFAKYISHLDFIAVIIRGLRQIEAPLSFTQGFNKREKISMGFPLPVGIESICELCDIEMYEDTNIDTLIKNLSGKFPEGIEAMNAEYLDKKDSLMKITCAADFEIDTEDRTLIDKLIYNLEHRKDFIKKIKNVEKTVPFDAAVLYYDTNEETTDTVEKRKKITIRLSVGSENSVRIDDAVLTLAETEYHDFYKLRITKVRQYSEQNGDYISL